MNTQTIALNRFGLGARRDQTIRGDPADWLVEQFALYEAKPAAIAQAPTSRAVAERLANYYDRQRMFRKDAVVPVGRAADTEDVGGSTSSSPADLVREARQDAAGSARQEYIAAVAARTDAALVTETPFVERMVHFWSNHFAVSADKLDLIGLAGTLEFEAVRPHVLGRFADMLSAVEQHPSMLIYLDQAVSIGPNSSAGRRVATRGKRKVGLNENLAREILELHTLGVGSGYTQSDVTEFARALTGWTTNVIGRGPVRSMTDGDTPAGGFFFAIDAHEPGDRIIVGKRYAATGRAQAEAALADLAASPATAKHLATKLARHFAGDTPPKPMIDRLQAVYLRSGGDLPALYHAIIGSPEAWVAGPLKFRTPWEWLIATHRALGTQEIRPQTVVNLLKQLGQPVWKPGQPTGYDDIAGRWIGSDAIMRRVQVAERLASRAPETDITALMRNLFPDAPDSGTAVAVARAESSAQGLALLLVSPEMMRR